MYFVISKSTFVCSVSLLAFPINRSTFSICQATRVVVPGHCCRCKAFSGSVGCFRTFNGSVECFRTSIGSGECFTTCNGSAECFMFECFNGSVLQDVGQQDRRRGSSSVCRSLEAPPPPHQPQVRSRPPLAAVRAGRSKRLLEQSFLPNSLSANGITSRGGRLLAEALQENSVLRIFW